MLTAKRVIIATAFGVVFGLVCMYLAAANPEGSTPMTTGIKLSILLSRTLTGFMIGISALSLPWWLHGIVLGAIGSVPMALATIDQPVIALSSVVMGVIYGFLIEVFTSVVFKERPVAMRK